MVSTDVLWVFRISGTLTCHKRSYCHHDMWFYLCGVSNHTFVYFGFFCKSHSRATLQVFIRGLGMRLGTEWYSKILCNFTGEFIAIKMTVSFLLNALQPMYKDASEFRTPK